MAIYHFNVGVASRGSGHSAVAGAAYLSRSALTLEREGVRFDYTRAHAHERLVRDLGVSLPAGAPARLADRSALWNEVEDTEARADAQLARRFEMALPDELGEAEQVSLARDLVAYFVGQGMCCDAAVHEGRDGRNAHLHILSAMRPVGPDGFGAKTRAAYLMRRDGEADRLAAADEAKGLEAQGWAKVYRYRGQDGPLTKEQAAALGLDPIKGRARKQPVQESVKSTDWDEAETLERWRADVARIINEALDAAGEADRVDHRSYAEQGVDLVPTLHEGPRVAAIERRAAALAAAAGAELAPTTDRRRENVEVGRLNAMIARAGERLAAIVARIVEALPFDLAAARAWVERREAARAALRDARAEREAVAGEREAWVAARVAELGEEERARLEAEAARPMTLQERMDAARRAVYGPSAAQRRDGRPRDLRAEALASAEYAELDAAWRAREEAAEEEGRAASSESGRLEADSWSITDKTEALSELCGGERSQGDGGFVQKNYVEPAVEALWAGDVGEAARLALRLADLCAADPAAPGCLSSAVWRAGDEPVYGRAALGPDAYGYEPTPADHWVVDAAAFCVGSGLASAGSCPDEAEGFKAARAARAADRREYAQWKADWDAAAARERAMEGTRGFGASRSSSSSQTVHDSPSRAQSASRGPGL